MLANQKLSEGISLLDQIAPISQGAGTVTTGWLNASTALRALAVIQAGVLGASATLDAKFQQAQDGSGTGAKDVPNKAMTQMTQAGGNGGKQTLINLNPDVDMDLVNGFSYFRLSVTVGVAASLIAAAVYSYPDYETADQFNNASVIAIVP